MLMIASVVLLAVCAGTYAQLAQDLCAGCVMVNGAGYNNHEDCAKFIQCHQDANGVLVGEVMNCPFGTYWNLESLACLPVEEVQCAKDRCDSLADGTMYAAETNCKGYWQCAFGRSKPMCCGTNETFDEVAGCIDDFNDTCYDQCFGVAKRTQIAKVCDLKEDVTSLNHYYQFVVGWGNIRWRCPPGTLFYKEQCGCLAFDETKPTAHKCRPEIHLPFTKDHRDESKPEYYVLNENVEVANGVAKFNGKNSRLVIPRFTNIDHSTTVVIKAKYSSNHLLWTGMAKALVSNSDCGNVPSIMISEDVSDIYFGVGTNEARFAYTSVPQLAVQQPTTPKFEKEVMFTFKNGELTGSNGVESKSVPAPGYLRNVRCALQIGHAENLEPFEGEIDELTIYLCDPDKQ